MGFMAVKDTLVRVESIMGDDNLKKVHKEYAIPVSIRLQMPGPCERMTMGSVTRTLLPKDVLITGLRFSILAIVAEFLRWYRGRS